MDLYQYDVVNVVSVGWDRGFTSFEHMETNPKKLVSHGLDGYAGFRHGQAYAVEVVREDDGTGEV